MDSVKSSPNIPVIYIQFWNFFAWVIYQIFIRNWDKDTLFLLVFNEVRLPKILQMLDLRLGDNKLLEECDLTHLQ